MKELRPAEVSPPGRLIKRELDERGWLQSDLAAILGRTDAVVTEIIQGKRGITPETARGLADAFGTSAQFWLNREASFRLSLLQDDDIVSRRARLYTKAPVREMIERGWLSDSKSIDVLEQQLLEFLEIKDLDDTPTFAHAARKSTPYDEPPTPAQQAWLFRAKQVAPAVSVAGAFSRKRIPELVEELHALAEAPESIRLVPRILSKYGIRLIVIEPLKSKPRSKIDGAFFDHDGAPVIVISLRYDRIDHFWHTLIHEIGHIWHEDGPRLDLDIVTDVAVPKGETPEHEKRANDYAANALIPRENLDDFIIRVRPLFSAKKIQGFAQSMEVHPGIAVGQLQRRDEIDYKNLRKMLVPIRHIIVGTALTDGWGTQLPT